MRERQEGHYYGLGITIVSVDGDITATERVRRIARLQEGHPARRRHREDRRRGRRRAGPPSRRCRSCAARKGTPVQIDIKRRGYEQLIPVEVTRDEVHHSDRPGVFHDRRDDRLHPLQDFGENTDRDVKHALHDLSSQGHAAAAVRHPRQSGRPARSGDQGRQRIPAARQDDRLHARPHRELGSGLPRDRRRASSPTFRS